MIRQFEKNNYMCLHRSNWMILSAAIGLLICLLLLCCFGKGLRGEVIGIISTITGMFGSCLKDAYGFEFGSSRGSKEKDFALIYQKRGDGHDAIIS